MAHGKWQCMDRSIRDPGDGKGYVRERARCEPRDVISQSVISSANPTSRSTDEQKREKQRQVWSQELKIGDLHIMDWDRDGEVSELDYYVVR